MRNQIAKILGMSADGELLNVQSVKPKDQFQRGGSMHGYRYEWGVNHYSWTENKEGSMEAFGLTEAEWDKWNQLFIMRFDWDKDAWYEDEAVKSYVRLSE